MFKFYISIACILLFGCNKGKNNPDSCNGSSTRREIKIATDHLANSIDTIAINTNVNSFGKLAVTDVDSESMRQSIEKKTFTITSKVHKLSKYRDGDWKVKLTDGNDKFVNCESPNIGCQYIDSSIFILKMKKVRDWIEANKDNLEGKIVTITGVAFIDKDHLYPRNTSDNELEIHPILDIHF